MKGKIFVAIFLLIFTSTLTLNAQWAKTYGGNEDNYVSFILQTSDGGYIVVGNTYSLVLHEYDSDFKVLKLNMLGDIEWQNSYWGGGYIDEISFIQQANDGGYIFGGTIKAQCVVIKLSVDGDIEWKKGYGY